MIDICQIMSSPIPLVLNCVYLAFIQTVVLYLTEKEKWLTHVLYRPDALLHYAG